MRRLLTVLLVTLLVAAGAVGPVAATEPVSSPETRAGATAPATGSSLAAEAPDNESNDSTTLTLLTYNDIQTAAVENQTFPRMVHLVNERRAAHDNPTVVVGGGDQVSPHALSPLTQWRTPVAALNVLDPAAEVIGNHDLDYGFGAVENFSNESEFPWLMANIVDEETGEPIPGTEPYTIVERDGVKVGIVGLADEAIKPKTAVDFDEEGYELRNYSTVASEYATMLKEERDVDVVVAAAHIGIPESKTLARETEHVDAIVVGDDELEYPPQETAGTVIVEAEARAEHVGEVNLTVEDGDVTAWNGRLLNVTEDVPRNETVATIISKARQDTLEEVAGRTTVPLDARFASNYHDETALGNMIGDSFRAKTGAEVAITNAGGIRSNSVYGPGNVTVGDVYNVLPFRNTLVTVELTGAELKQLLASQVVTLESETGQRFGSEAQLQVSGVTYEWVGHEGEEPYIRDAWVNGERLDEDETYTVTVNSYMAGWDDSVLTNATRVSTTNTLYGTALLDYIRNNTPVSPEDTNRIRRVDSVTDVEDISVQKGMATVTIDAPNGTTAAVPDSFYVTDGASGERLAADSVTLTDGTIEVTFENAAFRRMSGEGGSLELYGKYDTTAFDRVYFEHSVVNADLSASDSGGEAASDEAGHGADEDRPDRSGTASGHVDAGVPATPAA
ncbi:bifunctional UDP-sugar hydrolase/5'-nucleotidase [Haloarchaeobius sp. HME9146]|uniref:bifunctional metallophosphatase/5'-nucleotidase n=1 Tax=Haloarchaeobius sp. HME9146 TaxID=2978732 RepID=UPI0021C0C7D3|nr:bifunctional UDP-sugar hydrolase/5'-nucleotidase [Haloarchaeobius sp. HME9146]MCT9095520.1 bifunctional metallophosphatase/5'-nucleotidase [Haloarchaeobius sp. HME9146]